VVPMDVALANTSIDEFDSDVPSTVGVGVLMEARVIIGGNAVEAVYALEKGISSV